MNPRRLHFPPVTLAGYTLLTYILFLVPFHLYTPERMFDLPNLLWITHLLLLYIHEAGHLLFSVFGHTLTVMGGSLNQILIPFIWWIVAKREGSALQYTALFFTGVSVCDVSLYVKDAGMLVLPLIGGLSKSHHDWATLLNEWGMIEWGAVMGEMLFWGGFVLASGAIVLGVRRAVTEGPPPASD